MSQTTSHSPSITLCNGQKVYVSPEDFGWISQHHWYPKNGYACRHESQKHLGPRSYREIYMHREICARRGTLLAGQLCSRSTHVHHEDEDTLNNERENLTVHTPISHRQEHGYTKQRDTVRRSPGARRRPNRSGFKGVAHYRQTNKWQVMIQVPTATGPKNLYLGQYADPEEAAIIYDAAVIHYWGGAGYTNLVRQEDLVELDLIEI